MNTTTPMKPPRTSVRTFRFLGCDFVEPSREVSLRYGVDDTHTFVETFAFPGAAAPATPEAAAALRVAIAHLHLVCGISYWKALLPPEISIETGAIDAETARALDEIYTEGLGEFAHRNGLDLSGYIHFPSSPDARTAPGRIALPRRTAVPIGGGKDSLTTLEILRASGEPLLAIAVGRARPIRETIRSSGVPAAFIERRLSPELLALNERGAWNGHVPISAILAFLMPVAAILHGFDAAAFSNERSASAPTLRTAHGDVNHQYSKSLAFERLAARLIRTHVLANFDYFSFLRPMSEFAISECFATWLEKYPDFSSCNTNFKQSAQGDRTTPWCLDCAKCRSTFLLLAPFTTPAALTATFGANLFADPAQAPGFLALCGLEGTKPFDCVAEDYEYRAALCLAAREPAWRAAMTPALVRAADAEPDPDGLVRKARELSSDHELPPRFAGILHAHLGSRR